MCVAPALQVDFLSSKMIFIQILIVSCCFFKYLVQNSRQKFQDLGSDDGKPRIVQPSHVFLRERSAGLG